MCNHKAFYGYDKDYFQKLNCVYTSEEIAQQPKLWNDLGKLLLAKKNEISDFIEKIGDMSKIRIIFTGAGSSAFIGDALSVLLAKNAGIRFESIHSTDIVSAPKSYLFSDIPTLLVSFARSGNSPESIGAVKYARASIKNLYEVAIVCDDESNLYNIAVQSDKSLVLVMPEGSNDKGFAMTSSVSCMYLAGFALFNADKIDEIVHDISLLAENVGDQSIKFSDAASEWAKTDFERIVYLGSGFLKHLAHEASLKMMELTNGIVNGSYESATGFRHGPKSVMNDKTMTVHMISGDPFTAKYDIDLLVEVCSQQKENIVISICGCEAVIGACADSGNEMIAISSKGFNVCGELCMGLQMLVFCQMLAMYKSLALGVNTDDPSPNGVVNRVVKGVNVY